MAQHELCREMSAFLRCEALVPRLSAGLGRSLVGWWVVFVASSSPLGSDIGTIDLKKGHFQMKDLSFFQIEQDWTDWVA